MSRAEWRALIDDWRAISMGRPGQVRRRALGRLEAATPAELAVLGLAERDYARDWMRSTDMAAGLALSLLLLDRLTPITPLPATTWHDMYHRGESLGIPPLLARMTAHGPPLVRWLAAFARTGHPSREPTDAHIGGWMPARTALRLRPHLRPEGSDAAHDAIRRLLCALDDCDWLMISVNA
ncbi:hypothetical protein D3876_08745 [Sphingomonas cavernae]|uniref:Uncharacterized protein n=2 Tax=Sphingomonas cavernae TaxID=2320861 RepID=A0A418WJZ9_9SPHN|nr:hypothetical protein D3876_08745 [Sphingomonas cavernae]